MQPCTSHSLAPTLHYFFHDTYNYLKSYYLFIWLLFYYVPFCSDVSSMREETLSYLLLYPSIQNSASHKVDTQETFFPNEFIECADVCHGWIFLNLFSSRELIKTFLDKQS